jgi:predicted  nucleic acid-binding Zn-ribbon protein
MRSNGLRLLKVAEYTSLAASVAGVVISTASKQVVYAAAPLSLSMFLNLLNRQRFEQQTQQNLTTTTAQVEQQLSQLNRGFSQLQQEVRNELDQQIQALDVRVTSSQPAQVNLPDTIARFEERFSQLTANISSEIQAIRQFVQSQAAVVNPATLQDIQQGLSRLQERITAFESLNLGLVPQNLSQLQAQFEQSFSQLQASVSTLRQQLQSQEPTLDTAALQIVQQELAQLHNRIASIESLNFTSVLQTITQLQGQYHSLQESTDSFNQRLESFPSTAWVNSLQEEILQLQAGLEQLRSDLQQQQDNLQAELAQLQNELQALIKPLLPTPSSPKHEILPKEVREKIESIAVAYGLSIPNGEAPDVRLPSFMANVDSEELPPAPSRDRYEDTRDSG